MLLQVHQAILSWGDAYHPVERGVKRLTVGESDHIADLLHTKILIALVYENGHGFLNTILVNEGRVVHVETNINDGRNIAGICS